MAIGSDCELSNAPMRNERVQPRWLKRSCCLSRTARPTGTGELFDIVDAKDVESTNARGGADLNFLSLVFAD
jgi:hypothetical protein